MKTDIVVVVDDDRRVRDSIQSVLESAGHATFPSPTAEQFLQSFDAAELLRVIERALIDSRTDRGDR